MFRLSVLALLLGGTLAVSTTLVTWPTVAQEPIRATPSIERVEVEEIFVASQAALDAVREARPTHMFLGLWFAADWESKGDRYVPLVQLLALSPVEDDTGRLLSTEMRLKQNQYLRGEVFGDTWKSSGGRQGPVVNLLLDAPARGAETLKVIKGRARVALAKRVNLTFHNLAALDGKELEHADMKSLADMRLRFTILEEEDVLVSAKLSAPVNYAKPWNRGRVYDWELMKGERKLDLFSESMLPMGEGVTVKKSYRHRTSAGLSLRVVVLDSVESKEFSFDVRNVELP